MTTRFADAFFYIALLDSTDQHHRRVLAHAESVREMRVTTRWVLAEVADALSAPQLRQAALRLLERVEADPDTIIAGPSDTLFQSGVSLFAQRPDKHWSLTDCISFAVMHDHGFTEALTGDHHFAQAGFTAIFAV